MFKRARSGPSPLFIERFQNLPSELQSLILDLATVDFRALMANRIRLAFRAFKRRVGYLSSYLPSRQSLERGDPGARVVRIIRL